MLTINSIPTKAPLTSTVSKDTTLSLAEERVQEMIQNLKAFQSSGLLDKFSESISYCSSKNIFILDSKMTLKTDEELKKLLIPLALEEILFQKTKEHLVQKRKLYLLQRLKLENKKNIKFFEQDFLKKAEHLAESAKFLYEAYTQEDDAERKQKIRDTIRLRIQDCTKYLKKAQDLGATLRQIRHVRAPLYSIQIPPN